MDFKQLEAYVKVIELASFSKAAEAIYLSQPSVSAYVNSLEKELGAILINRSTKELSPTAAGKIFYEKVKEIITLKCNTVEQIKSLSGNLSGEINIIASTVPSLYILPKLIACFRNLHPNISFCVRQADTSAVVQGIATQKFEIGFAGGVVANDKCIYKEFMSEKLIFIAPHNEKFCKSNNLSLQEILYENAFISREKGSGTRIEYEKYFIEHGISLNRINTCASFDNTQSIINSVINGLGVSVVSEYAANDYIKRKMILPIRLKIDLPERKFFYVLKKNFSHSHLLDFFISFLQQKS